CQSGQTEKSSSEKPASKLSDTNTTVVTTEDLDPENEAEQIRWPHQVTTDKYTITFYEPQPTEWDNYQQLQAWMAISATGEGLDEKLYGALELSAETHTDFLERKVMLSNIRVSDTHLPENAGDAAAKLKKYVTEELIKVAEPVNLDNLLDSLKEKEIPRRVAKFNMDPPEIFVRNHPALLVSINGETLYSAVPKAKGIEFVVNTNWDLFKDSQSSQHYLLNRDQWYTSSTLDGKWLHTTELPSSLSSLPNEESWQTVRENIPPNASSDAPTPEILIAHKPSELILIDGDTDLAAISGTGISYVKNTVSDLFNHSDTWYYLVSGRWFKSSDLSAWVPASNDLPVDFAQIPSDHLKSYVVASVPGTLEARLAVMQSQIPVQATVNRSVVPVQVTYAGEPQFEKVLGTDLYWAVNTQYDVIQFKDQYYICQQGIWFVGPGAKGPFVVATHIPVEFSSIPPTHPLYHVVFVKVYEVHEQTVVTGYTSGYHNQFHFGMTVVYGTGWYYSPYSYYDPFYGYPYYYHYPRSYGMGTYYNPVNGAYGRRGAVYGPYGGASRGAFFNPETGTYARGRSAWDSDTFVGQAAAYNPRTGISAITEQGVDDYDRWGETVIRRGRDTVSISKRGDERGTVRNIQSSQGGRVAIANNGNNRAAVGQSSDGNIYAGKDGSVYKRDDNGWHKRSDGDWQTMDMPNRNEISDRAKSAGSADLTERIRNADRAQAQNRANQARSQLNTMGQLDRDHRSRTQGQNSQRNYQRYNRTMGGATGNRGAIRARRR
ncbi:MAG: hypothetical protein KUG75_13100, partial [Pseudomonadales bacterium]|nr:hypothetical protein [Pseudomonadales bacterium]